MTTADKSSDIPGISTEKKKPTGKRLVIAIIMAVVVIAIDVSLYMPGMFLAGMMTDSCSGGASYIMWDVWIVYGWPVVMLAAALLPPFLVYKGKSVKRVVLTFIACAAAGLVWYLLWIPVLSIAGC